jgi:site-specific DNA recombinase
MRTKVRDGFIKALRDARRWLDELLCDRAQTIESLAARAGKSERSIRMTLSLAFISPVLAEAAMEGRLPRGQRQAPDPPPDGVVRTVARRRPAGAD